jgi:hypothetical protein
VGLGGDGIEGDVGLSLPPKLADGDVGDVEGMERKSEDSRSGSRPSVGCERDRRRRLRKLSSSAWSSPGLYTEKKIEQNASKHARQRMQPYVMGNSLDGSWCWSSAMATFRAAGKAASCRKAYHPMARLQLQAARVTKRRGEAREGPTHLETAVPLLLDGTRPGVPVWSGRFSGTTAAGRVDPRYRLMSGRGCELAGDPVRNQGDEVKVKPRLVVPDRPGRTASYFCCPLSCYCTENTRVHRDSYPTVCTAACPQNPLHRAQK